jgi:hypothetical protein
MLFFWDRKGVLMVEFMQSGITITSQVYCKTPRNCIGPFRMKGVEYIQKLIIP